MNTFITNEQLVNFVLNTLSEEEQEMISEAIISNSEIKDRYLFEKRKNDIERYINDEMNIGERCEIEELIKMDSRLFDHFELNGGVIEDEQDEQDEISHKHISVTEEQLMKFVLNLVNEEEHQKISEAIKIDPVIKERFLFAKRKCDVERYFNNKMDIGERCEIEELLISNARLFEYFELIKSLGDKEQNISVNPMHPTITKVQLASFVLNRLRKKERKNIIEAINTNPEIKEWYLLEKRKHDVERYINDEMDIGEQCEIEELIKMNPRLYDHFVRNTEAIDAGEQDASKITKQIPITKEQLAKFILKDINDKAYIEEYKNISEAINTNPITKERYLFEKRKQDVERYLDGKMDFEECCEIDELLRINLRLFEYLELKKDINEEKQTVFINGKQIAITKEMLVNFVSNDVSDEEREMISEAIISNSLIKDRYLYEKRKNDIERCIDGEMTIGEHCEIEELIKMDSRLFDYFELNNGCMEEGQDVPINPMHLAITNEQLENFVSNDVNEHEHKNITEAINTNHLIKERYLFEKRKYDIERYNSNEVDFGEGCEIKELIDTNSRINAHYNLKNDIDDYLEDTLDKFAKINDEISSKEIAFEIKLKPSILRIGKWVAAASIIILIGLSGGNIYLKSWDSLENRLYAKYYKPLSEEKVIFFKSSSLNEAINKYFNKEYDVALMLLENLSSSTTIEVEKQLYYGLTLMELRRFNEALETFEDISVNNNRIAAKPLVDWNLALCYLKTGKQEKAKELFGKIVQSNNFHYKEAKRILEKLNK
ncbi:MAG: hypothetical protein GQ564_04065 [Bacteroidales bacterium]|nr:hypothetical protein [Bacteroidales bacterium]